MTKPIEVGAFIISCGDCGRALTRSRYTQDEADQDAMEKGYGVPGEWRCDDCQEKHRNPRGDYLLTEEYAYDHSNVAGVEVETRRARTPHPCNRHRNCQIRPGQQYIRQTVAPWVMVADDVDDEGRTIGSRNNEWSVSSWHRYSDEANEDRKGECKWCRVMPGEAHKTDCPKWEES